MTKPLTLLLPLALLTASPAARAAGCAPAKCVARTGSWVAPSPQKLTSPFGPTPLTMKVGYRRNGKLVKSRYGNSVEDFSVYLRYFCANESSPWVETGFATMDPIPIKRDGTVKVTVPANYAFREHRLTLRFKPTTFSGRLSGSATNIEGAVCSMSVSFSGRRKS